MRAQTDYARKREPSIPEGVPEEHAGDQAPDHRNPEQAIRLVRTMDGRWEAADEPSEALEHDRGLEEAGLIVLAFIYVPRCPHQWHKAHQLARFLAQHVAGYHGMSSHKALKKLQKDSGAACDEQEMKLGPEGITATLVVPRSMAFGWMDETEFKDAYRTMCAHVREQYFPDLDGEATEAMERCMLKERAA